MSANATRIGGGFLALAAIWIGVYWFWEPSRSIGVSFADDGPEADSGRPAPGVVEIDPEPDQEPGPSPETGDPEPSESGVIAPEFDEYIIQKNDTFASISERFYGTERHADVIARANPLMSPTSLQEGRPVRVPVDPGNVQGVPTGPDEPVIETPQMLEYVVVRGDTLSEIAQRFYGSMRHAPVIFNANRDRMTSMDDLELGQVLLIPSREAVLGEDDG